MIEGIPAWLEKLERRAKPAFVFLAFGAVGVIVAVALVIAQASVADVVIVSMLFVVLPFIVEIMRESLLVRQALSADAPYAVCWSEDDTIQVLRKLDNGAPQGCRVHAVWGTLSVSSKFEDFLTKQLQHLDERDYRVHRWVDTGRVDEDHVLKHIDHAYRAMQAGRYVLHLVPAAPFGAFVVGQDAAINFQVHRWQPDVICVHGKDQTLLDRVTTMINELGPGWELPNEHPESTSQDYLRERAREYYATEAQL